MHLNVPLPGEPQYKQILRRIGWSILAVIAPELVALNAWLQYRRANELMKGVNRLRGLDPPSSTPRAMRTLQHLRWVGTYLGKAFFAVLSIPDWLRMTFHHRRDFRMFERERHQSHVVGLQTQLDKDVVPWTITTAFYAISGAIILVDDCEKDLVLGTLGFRYLARHNATALIPIQRAALQNPGKASVLAKMITCAQALWFCSQSIARLSQNMAISLIELNTFAHCISAFFIYAFWWHKPYDVDAHVYVDNAQLLQDYLLSKISQNTWLVENASEDAIWDGRCNIIENNPHGQMSTVATDVMLLGPWAKAKTVHQKIKYGATIPGTGFKLLRTHGAGGTCPDVALTNLALAFWKRLWRLRSIDSLDSRLGHSAEPNFQANIRMRAKNLDEDFLEFALGDDIYVSIILISTFLVYGGIHLLAWKYNFQTNAEELLWRIAAITTASSGLILVLSKIADFLNDEFDLGGGSINAFHVAVYVTFMLLIGFEGVARSFLIVESFRALPNSPSSVYEIPRWTAYLPYL